MGSKVIKIVDVRLTLLKSHPPQTVVDCWGLVSSGGWTNARLEPRMYVGGTPPDGVLDLDFVAEPPDGMATWVVSPIRASINLGDVPSTICGIRVHSTSNVVERSLMPEDLSVPIA